MNDRVFDGRSSAATLQQLTISGGALGTVTDFSTESDGGGIRNGGNMKVLDTVVRNNTASRGGGVATFGGTFTMLRSTISDNRATAGDTGLVADGGGGIFSINNTFTLRDSTVQNNISFRDGGGVTLAPIFFPSTPMKIERTLIAGNSAQNDGGGVFVTGKNGGSALIDNSTVSGNQTSRLGGGISAELLPLDKPLVLNAVTIAGNSAPGSTVAVLRRAGARSRQPMSIWPTTLVETASSPLSRTAGSTSRATTFAPSARSTTVRATPAPNSARWHFNGGPTRTHMLLEGSPAIDGGVSTAAIAFDQRGSFRFAEFRPGGNRFDMGAVESNAFGVGEFEVTAPTTAAAEELVVLNATWVHPERWRDLNTVEVQLRSDEALGMRVAFTEGVSTVGGVEVTDGLTLYDSDGTVAGVGVPGEDAVLESDTALLDLGASSLEGSGPTGTSVRLVLAVRLKASAAGRVYTTTLLASDDEGMIQGPHDTGTLTVDAPQ